MEFSEIIRTFKEHVGKITGIQRNLKNIEGHLKKFNERRAKNEPQRAKHEPKCTFQTAYMIHGPAPA